MPYTTLVAGTTITSAWANANVRDQVVTPFATAAARASAITAPAEGMYSDQADTDALYRYDAGSTAWRLIASAAAWTAYTPTWTCSGAAPTLGNGTLSGQYRYISHKLAVVEIRLVVGSTTTFGTGAFFWTLPVTAASANQGGGTWHIVDTGVQEYCGVTKLETTTTFRGVLAAGGNVSGTTPFGLGNTDVIRAQLIFEPA